MRSPTLPATMAVGFVETARERILALVIISAMLSYIVPVFDINRVSVSEHDQ